MDTMRIVVRRSFESDNEYCWQSIEMHGESTTIRET
jgi:hypothetical protein